MKTIIIIPARHGSTRFPGKPLADIYGKTMLQRVWENAEKSAEKTGAQIVIATDNKEIAAHAKNIGAEVVMTPHECKTGTDRALSAINSLSEKPEIIINLQGDSPLTPPRFITSLIEEMESSASVPVATLVVQLTWQELESLRENKKTTPFSGTTAIVDKNNDAIWFSKNIIPAIREEEKLSAAQNLSPVFRHIGIYGYRRKVLEDYVKLPQSHYEKLEGLEQLRLIENGYKIRAVKVDYKGYPSMSGIDTEEDAKRAEKIIKEHGEPQ